MTPHPWQLAVLKDWLGVRADGRWSSIKCGLAVPRQNGKNAVLEVRELFGMVVLGEKFLHTAHEVKTARKAFLRLASFFENPRRFPELASLVSEIRKTNGQEAIVLTNGGSCEFVARSKGSGRGFTVDALVMDEAQELSDEALEALLPTISASPSGNPQQIYTGTPPGPKATGDIFTRVRADGLARRDRRLSWHEWSCMNGADLDDPVNLAASNPSLGLDFGLQAEVAAAERGSMSPEGYGRERLGIWDDLSVGSVINAADWAAVKDEASRTSGTVVFAADMSPDHAFASIAVAGLRDDGVVHVEVVDHRPGSDWLVAEIARLRRDHNAQVVVDKNSPIGALLADLERAGVPLIEASGPDITAACGAFFDSVTNGTIRHIGQVQLDRALGNAARYDVGDGAWRFSRRKSSADISPLYAAVLAAWAVHRPVDVTRSFW